MNIKRILFLLFSIIIFILFLLLYRNYKQNEENIMGNGFKTILNKDDIMIKLENMEDILSIDISNIKNIELSNIFNNEVYWNIEINNNIFIRFNAISSEIEEYKDNNDYSNEIIDHMKYDEVKEFIIDKYINLGYNSEYSLESIEKNDNTYLWEAIFNMEGKKIVIKFIPEINRIISIDSV